MNGIFEQIRNEKLAHRKLIKVARDYAQKNGLHWLASVFQTKILRELVRHAERCKGEDWQHLLEADERLLKIRACKFPVADVRE